MHLKKILHLSFVLFFLLPFKGVAQFILNGSATITTPECSSATTTYQLTPDVGGEAGEIWYATQISLANRFDIQFQIFLGTKDYYGDNGADGVCFVFQQQSTSAGSPGGGMGFGGITPSLGIEYDTYENGWDPAFCHTAIEKNGDVDHTDGSGNNLAGPVQLSSTNPDLPDGAWHNMEIIWDPISKTLSEYCDCVFRLSYTGDVVNSIFGGNPNVYWGFTAGTGGASNLQEVCISHSYLNNLRDTSVCSGNPVILTSSGGVSYSWAPAAGLSATTGVTVTATPTSTTTYTVSITNSCGLISKDSVTITVNPLPTVAVNSATVCAGTSATLTGAGAATYSWSTGVTNNPITVTPTSTTNYTVTGTDANGCINSAISTVTVNPLPTVTVNSATICVGTSATLTGNGAAAYSWSDGETTNPITVSPVVTTTYTVTGTTAGCTGSAVATVTVAPSLSVTITPSAPTICFGSSTTLTGNGATTFSWSDGETTNTITVNPTTNTNYTVTGTTAGCTGTASATVTVDLLKASAAGFPATCAGVCNGYTEVIPTGGTLPYTYLWTPSGSVTANANNLCAGNYCIKVSDANGCSVDTCVAVTEPTAMNVSIASFTNDSCFGECDGTATSLATGGTAPYTYSWNSVPAQTTVQTTGLCAGTYTVTVTDANGCSNSASVTITQPTQLTVTPSAAATICIGQSTMLSATANGGTPAYAYSWNNTYNGQNYTVTPTTSPTTYTIIATDANGCLSAPETVVININPPLNVIAKSDTSICIGGHVNLSAIGSGGNGIYTYVWEPSAIAGSVINVTPVLTTIYTVTVTDNCGTPADSDKVTVTVNQLPIVSFSADSVSGCYPLCVTFTNSSTPTSASATWEFGDENSSSSVATANNCYQNSGLYTVQLSVTDSFGCTNSTSVSHMINVFPHPTANFSTSPNPITIIQPTVYFKDLSAGGVNQWEWSLGTIPNNVTNVQNPQYTYQDTGYYNVQLIVTDSNGCKDSITQTIYVEGQFVIYVPNAFTPNGDGLNDTFYPKGTGISPNNYQMYIYDRWGNLIFQTTNLNQGWNGKVKANVQEDVYVWEIICTDFQGKGHQYFGHVSVVK